MKIDYLIIGGILLLALIFMIIPVNGNKSEAIITINGAEFGKFKLSENKVIQIGANNTAAVEDGQIRMSFAGCSDQVCVHSKPIGKNSGGRAIICLPNRVEITLSN